jgi:hypothetical protein
MADKAFVGLLRGTVNKDGENMVNIGAVMEYGATINQTSSGSTSTASGWMSAFTCLISVSVTIRIVLKLASGCFCQITYRKRCGSVGSENPFQAFCKALS